VLSQFIQVKTSLTQGLMAYHAAGRSTLKMANQWQSLPTQPLLKEKFVMSVMLLLWSLLKAGPPLAPVLKH
jgi:hypothetical protein